MVNKTEQVVNFSPDTRGRIRRGLEIVPFGVSITLEGPPIYLNAPWNDDQEIGYNGFLPFVLQQLEGRAASIQHNALLDNYTVDETFGLEHYFSRMSVPPDVYCYESQFAPPAQRIVQQWICRGLVQRVGSSVRLLDDVQPEVITRSGRVSCALLDAVFQQQKGNGWHIIIHPTLFRSQQQNMRSVLACLPDSPKPYSTVNIFTKGNNLSQIIYTPLGEASQILRI